jgi:hypothetical protein
MGEAAMTRPRTGRRITADELADIQERIGLTFGKNPAADAALIALDELWGVLQAKEIERREAHR